MLAELILNLLTPASTRDRGLGLVDESIGVWSRGRRRRRERAEHERRYRDLHRAALRDLRFNETVREERMQGDGAPSGKAIAA